MSTCKITARNRLSVILCDTSEDNQMPLEIAIGEDGDENVGISSLDLPWTKSVYRDSEGKIWFQMDYFGTDGNHVYMEFDELSDADIRNVLEVLST